MILTLVDEYELDMARMAESRSKIWPTVLRRSSI